MQLSLNRRTLKWLALITMTIDHLGGNLIRLYPEFKDSLLIMRLIGRWAFPLFAFQLAISYKRKNDVPKFLKNLFILAVISEITYDLRGTGKLFTPGSQNIVWSFFLVVLAFWASDLLSKRYNKIPLQFYQLILLVTFAIIVYVGKIDYGVKGFLLTALMIFVTDKVVLSLMPLMLFDNSWVRYSLFLLPIALYFYDDKPIKYGKWEGTFYHYYYPAHLFILYLIFLF